ncbi:MAG: response regulator [Bacteroidetes bacterium]|nr:response regulator [Bacteroidota bacterium]
MKIKEPKCKYKCAMLIDDNSLDNFINEKTLEANYFAKVIYTNTSATSALEFLKNISAADKNPNGIFPEVVFIDLNMPLLDGFQFIEQYKSKIEPSSKTPRLVILTSSVSVKDQHRAAALGKEIIFLHKPLTSSMLQSI